MTDAEAIRDVVRAVAADVLADGPAVATQLTESVHALAPGVSDEVREATFTAGVAVVTQLAERLRDGRGMEDVVLPASLVAYAEEFVHGGVDLSVLLGVVRVGYARFAGDWSARLQATGAPPEVLVAALSDSLLAIFAYVDVLSSGLAVTYGDERERWSRSLDAVRADLVQALLHDRSVDLQVAEQRLGHRLDRPQLAFLLWGDADEGGSGIALEKAARQLAAAVGASRSLLIPTGSRLLSGWIAGADAQLLRRIVEAGVPATAGQPRIRCAVGRVCDGPRGFRETHRQAVHARRIAEAAGAPGGSVTAYDDIALAALASADLEHAAAFTRSELGALAGTDETTRRIADTAQVYLAEGRNRARAARALGLHPNTIAYRLEQAAQLLGHPLSERATEVEVALRLARLGPGARD